MPFPASARAGEVNISLYRLLVEFGWGCQSSPPMATRGDVPDGTPSSGALRSPSMAPFLRSTRAESFTAVAFAGALSSCEPVLQSTYTSRDGPFPWIHFRARRWPQCSRTRWWGSR
eukprot:scaffold141_cov123-Isochrysis_galbana.AAC.11